MKSLLGRSFAILLVLLSFSTLAVLTVNAQLTPMEIIYETLPIITIHKPANNDLFLENTIQLNLTITKPENWLIHGGYNAIQILKSINYQLDGKYSDHILVNNDLALPYNYRIDLTNLTEGFHILKVYAYASGWVIHWSGLYEYEIPINSSSPEIKFTIDTKPPEINILSNNSKDYISVYPLEFTVNEVTSELFYCLDNQFNNTIPTNYTLTGLPDGAHNITVYTRDLAGNLAVSETIQFNIVDPFPTTTVIASAIMLSIVAVGILVYFKKRRS